jgi:uncharacterized repeat protein (TIGR01451 family)
MQLSYYRSFWQRAIHLFGRLMLMPALLIPPLLLNTQAVQAEGSHNMVASGGSRPYLEWSGQSTAGIGRRSLLYVYVQAGEEISLGSSVPTSFTNPQDIIYRSPAGTQNGSCDVLATGFGLIDTVAKETAGPLPSAGGYTPCTLIATETGVYEVEFHGPEYSTLDIGNPPSLGASTAFPTDATQLQTVAAWDITVRATPGGAIRSGRVFADYLALNMGGGAATLDASVYVLTQDGYLYQVDLNGQQPFGFIFFCNDDGFIDPATDNGLYRSVQLNTSNDGFLADATVHSPALADTTTHITHKIFFQQPDPALPAAAPYSGGTMWLLGPPIPPAVPTNVSFTGTEGTPGQAGSGLGGYFRFTSSFQGSYRIVLDINQNGVYTDTVDRVLMGSAQVGVNDIFWDGLDGEGNIVLTSGAAYSAYITVNGGEVHFPFLDVENNLNGFIIRRLNGPGATPDETVYYNDNYGNFGSQTGHSTPLQMLFGTSSPAHAFSNSFGDHKGIDTWAFVPSDRMLFGPVWIQSADLAVQKVHSPATFVAGGLVSYTITVTNNGPSPVVNATFTDTVPAEISGVSWTCSINSGTGSCGAASGTGNAINTTINLDSGTIATYTVTGTLSAGASGSLTNTATITRPPDVSDPDTSNNTSTDIAPIDANGVTQTPTAATPTVGPGITPVIGQIDPVLTKSVTPSQARPGDVVTWTVVVSNPGTQATWPVTVTDQIPAAFTITRVTATRGTVTQNGNLVTMQIGMLLPGEQAQIVIETVVNDTAPAGSVTNIANAGHLSARASINLFPASLPATGGKPVDGAGHTELLIAESLVMIGVAGCLIMRRRSRATV